MSSPGSIHVPASSTSANSQRAGAVITSLALPTSSTFSFTAPYPASLAQPPKVSSTSASTPTSPSSLKQQRRTSLALPSSPRQFNAWSFRDDTTLQMGNGVTGLSGSSAQIPEKKGKIRRISDYGDFGRAGESVSASFVLTSRPTDSVSNSVPPPPTGSASSPGEVNDGPSLKSGMGSATPTLSNDPPKKPRKKWSMEETQMLVTGCNKVSCTPCLAVADYDQAPLAGSFYPINLVIRIS
jgi:hypothetical protein